MSLHKTTQICYLAAVKNLCQNPCQIIGGSQDDDKIPATLADFLTTSVAVPSSAKPLQVYQLSQATNYWETTIFGYDSGIYFVQVCLLFYYIDNLNYFSRLKKEKFIGYTALINS